MNSTQLSRVRNARVGLQTISVGDAPATDSPRLGVDDETLKSYPVLLYSEVKRDRKGGAARGGDFAATCSICLGDFSDSDRLRELPDCHHLFHQKCIDMWLRMNSSCPLCRTSPLPTPVSTPLAEVAPLARSSGA
ncbi:RING-H2 finger protein ATL70-like [Neltuma alba]|uniref:RING-H2 finger protein ATL70-like n=1 Tax=Neltuma alba TaxID=207710 RepID=UPI0010A38760|nr:RING-H2 finger protein ATL70-like [Prosopis alba]